ncbi:MAG: anthranilate synthase component I [Candidatus Omnitrophota bacterium]|nr:anthranilate synthase component I [Candidatus Omnitrophota bacterium]
MYYPSETQFIKLAKKNNLIPVYKEIFADTETPVSAYLKLKKEGCSYLLESIEGTEKIARFSFLGTSPLVIFKAKKNIVSVAGFGEKPVKKDFTARENPLAELKKIISGFSFAEVKGLPRFSGGFVGYLGYDMVRFFEPKLAKNKIRDELGLPDACFMLAENLIIFDHVRHCLKIIINVDLRTKNLEARRRYRGVVKKIEEIEAELKTPIVNLQKTHGKAAVQIKSNIKKADFKKMVLKAKEYIKKGDVIQVVLSQRFSSPVKFPPFDIYRNLRSINPSSYMYYLDFGDVKLAGSSPEMFVRCENGLVQTRPIAGTRRRGKNAEEDAKLSRNLLSDAKEKAEHLMLVDLGRNDLGRVCKYGTVSVNEFMNIEKYSHVMHIVSNVRGKLRKDKDVFDVLSATFPAGTVTGAPKVRAMEIIDELEKVSRGPYAGCVGYFSFSGNLDTCITIRTIVIKRNTVYIQAGAGIVADSDPDKEYLETVSKAMAQIEALK